MSLPVSGSTRRTSTDGKGKPTEPSIRVENGRAQESAIPTSVMPYLSSKTFPEERSVQACLVGVGRAAEPEMLSLKVLGEIASFAAACMSKGNEGKVERRRV